MEGEVGSLVRGTTDYSRSRTGTKQVALMA